MSMPFYVAPEQMMKDRADYARKGIARGRALVAVRFVDGIAIVAENASDTLRKVSEIYDRIAFAAVGRYNEFENLRIAGVRLADMRGYSYDRRDVTGRGLANAYAQTLGTIFSSGGEKPYEIEIFVAEVGDSPEDDQVFRLTFDGQVVEVGRDEPLESGAARRRGRRSLRSEAVDQASTSATGRDVAPWAAATGPLVSSPSWVLSPRARAGSRRSASRQPRSARLAA